MKRIIELKNICKAFDGEQVLSNIDLFIHDKEFVTLLGPSGCGKTTTLRIIGGFENPDSGEIVFDGKSIADVPPYKRNVNTVFQKYALFPHLNVYESIVTFLLSKPRRLTSSSISFTRLLISSSFTLEIRSPKAMFS